MPTAVPITVGSSPAVPAMLPDGSKVYVPNSGDGTVSVIDTTDQSVLTTINVGGPSTEPYQAAATPDGSLVLVALGGVNDLTAIDTSSESVTWNIGGFSFPYWVVISADGSTAYVMNSGDTTVSVVDVGTATITDTITGVGSNPICGALSPDGTRLYVGCNHSIAVIDTGSNSVIATPSVTGYPFSIQVSADGSTLYYCQGETGYEGDIHTMDTTTFATGTISVGGDTLNQNVLASDGETMYVTDSSSFPTGLTYILDVSTEMVTGTLTDSSDNGPWGVCVNEDQSQVYVTLIDTNVTDYFALANILPLSGSGSIEFDAEDADLHFAVLVPLTGSASIAYDTEPADLHFAVLVPLSGTAAIAYDTLPATIIVGIVDFTGTASIAYDTNPADLTLHSIPHKMIKTLVLAGDPGPYGYGVKLTPTPPNPVPGPFGNHDYEVVVCDLFGLAYGVIPTAVPTQVDYVLDGIGQCLIDFAQADPLAPSLLPMSAIPGVREIQIWRDQVLIWWGWPVSATWDAAQVHLTCQGLLWPLSKREIGPEVIHYVTNTQFEQGLDYWTHSDTCLAFPETTTVLLGEGAARLICGAAGEDSYLAQNVVIDLTDSTTGIALALSAYVYVDGNFEFLGNALDNRGLYMEDENGNFSFVEIDDTIPQNTWTRLEVQPASADGTAVAFIAPPGVVTTYQLRLYCPGGSVVWDNVILKAYENVSSPPASPPATAWDVADIIEVLVATAQQQYWGKSNLQYQYYAAATGVLLYRVYLVDDSEVYLDAINEFPTIGVCDFEMVWDETGHFRGLEVFSPAKGSIKYNFPIDLSVQSTTDLAGAVDGTQVGTTQRVFGQGSSGPARDAGYAQFASYLGGRVVTDAVFVIGTNTVTSATANFTDDDLLVNIYSLNGALYPSTYITNVISATEAEFNNDALLSLTGETFGIGGVVLDASQSALPNQPVSTLTKSAKGWLIQQMQSQALPSSKVRADGPNGLFGMVVVGDVIPLSSDYGWVKIDPVLARVAQITLYPPTEEMEMTVMPVGSPVAPS